MRVGAASRTYDSIESPGSNRTTRTIARFDATVDAWFEPLRGRRGPDRVFEIASNLGDWGLIWHLVTIGLALRSDADLRRTPKLLAGYAAESLIVNQGVKRLFHRPRPGPTDRPEVATRLREPVTSSFPSGHASAAAFATVMLCDQDPRLRAIITPIAVIVATSRIHTRMHHPSDVVAGACIGWALGHAARLLWSSDTPGIDRGRCLLRRS